MDFLGAALKECTAPKVVISGFASTGLFPWDRNLILKNAKEFTAPALSDAAAPASSPLDIAVAATLHVLDEHDQKAKASKRHVRVSKNHIYIYDQLLDEEEERKKEKERLLKDKERRAAERREASERRAGEKQQQKRKREAQQQARQAEKEQAKRRRADAAATWSCKACDRRCRNHRSPDWLWCEYCDTFGICPYRDLCKDGPAVLERHEEEERKRGTAPVTGT